MGIRTFRQGEVSTLERSVLVARPLWPAMSQLSPIIGASGYRVESAACWSRLVDPDFPVEGLVGVVLGEYGNLDEEVNLLHRFRARRGAAGVPVILVGGRNARQREAAFREAGADLLLMADEDAGTLANFVKPMLRLSAMYRSLELRTRDLRDRSGLDDLTGLPNRRQFKADLQRNLEMARRIGRPVSCIIVDIDDFRAVNERHGQPAGDAVIRQFGESLDRGRRAYDAMARLGGDEFAWILVDADREGALHAATRAHRELAGREFGGEAGGGTVVQLTATFGVASVDPGADLTADALVGNADRALYWGKESGKNVVRFYPPKRAVNDDSPHPHIP
jgi:diguanylate cyclase (GGDEF)-like protein